MDTRPCRGCETGAPFDGSYNNETQCRLCWLFHNDERYRAYWTNQPILSDIPDQNIDPNCVKQKNPSWVRMGANLTSATAEWIKEGRPVRSDEECQRIHKICEACPHYAPSTDRCTKCGCGLSANASTSWIFNLGIPDGIRMASHSCPIGKW